MLWKSNLSWRLIIHDGLFPTFIAWSNCRFYYFSRFTACRNEESEYKSKGFLNAFALGILVFLIIDVFSHAWESAESAASDAVSGKASIGDAIIDLVAMFGGIAIGLLGLVLYEHKYMTKKVPQILSMENIHEGDSDTVQQWHNPFTD